MNWNKVLIIVLIIMIRLNVNSTTFRDLKNNTNEQEQVEYQSLLKTNYNLNIRDFEKNKYNVINLQKNNNIDFSFSSNVNSKLNLPYTESQGSITNSLSIASISGPIALFKDRDPWGVYTMNEDILHLNEIPFEIHPSSDMGIIDLFQFQKVIIVGDQPISFYNSLSLNQVWFEEFVLKGGLLEIHMLSNDYSENTILPGEILFNTEYNDIIKFELPNHFLLNIPNVIPDGSLNFNGNSSYGFLSNLPVNADVILSSNGRPNTIEFDLGLGNILITTGSYEWGYQFKSQKILENMLLFDPSVADDLDPPIISHPIDFTIEFGSSNNTIFWDVGDKNPNNYSLYKNDLLIQNGTWINGSLAFPIDSSILGSQFYNLTLFDIRGNFVSDIVEIIVEDTINPLIDGINDINLEFGEILPAISWDIFDLLADSYEIYLDGTLLDSGMLQVNNTISIELGELYLGVYNLTLIAFDTSGNIANDFIVLSITDTTIPLINGPEDLIIVIGSTSNFINWTVSDLAPQSYSIFRNSSLNDQGNWLSDDLISISLDQLDLGFYLFELIINDTSGNISNDIVNVSVVESGIPFLSDPIDLFFSEGTLGHTITWFMNDKDPSFFVLTENNRMILNESWEILTFLQISLDGLAAGNYNYNLTLFDKEMNYIWDSVSVIVYPNLQNQDLNSTRSSNSQFPINPIFLAGAGGLFIVTSGIYTITRRR